MKSDKNFLTLSKYTSHQTTIFFGHLKSIYETSSQKKQKKNQNEAQRRKCWKK